MNEIKVIPKVKCPNCGTIREINGTEERVRCSNKESCGMRYYTHNNVVPYIGTPLKISQIQIDTYTDKDGNITLDKPKTGILAGLDETSDFKRLLWYALMGFSWRGSNETLDKKLKEKLTILRSL